MEIKKSFLIQFIFLCISPVIGLGTAVLFLIKGRFSPFILSFSLALILIYMPLMYDVSSGFFAYLDYESGYIVNQLHFINYIAGFIYRVAAIDYFYIVLFVCFTSLYFWFKTYENIAKQSCSNKVNIFIFVIFIFLLSYKELMDLNRSFFAYCIAMYAISSFQLHGRKVLRNSSFILAFLVHPSSLIISGSYLLAKYIRLRKLYFLLFVLLSFFIGMKIESFLPLILIFIPGDSFLQTYFTSDKWGASDDVGFGKLLLYFIQGGLIFSCVLLALKNNNDRLSKTFLFVVIFFFLFIKFRVFGERFFLASTICIPLILIGVRTITYKLLVVFFFAILKFSSYNFYIFGYIFTDEFNYVVESPTKRNEMMLKPAYLPTLYLLNIYHFGYSNDFIKVESRWRIETYNNKLSGNE